MHPTVKKWLGKSREELDEIYSSAGPGEIPSGDTQGTAILAGSMFSNMAAGSARILAWQGKVFDAARGYLKNRITIFGIEAIMAKVYKGESWLDGKECIVLDYSDTSLIASRIRDEIRLIGPGFYLGKVYWDKDRLIDFCLKF